MTDEVTEMPRCFSISIQSDVACRGFARFDGAAKWMAPPNSSSFSVNVVFPASGWEIMRTYAVSSLLVRFSTGEHPPPRRQRARLRLRDRARHSQCRRRPHHRDRTLVRYAALQTAPSRPRATATSARAATSTPRPRCCTRCWPESHRIRGGRFRRS